MREEINDAATVLLLGIGLMLGVCIIVGTFMATEYKNQVIEAVKIHCSDPKTDVKHTLD